MEVNLREQLRSEDAEAKKKIMLARTKVEVEL